jgi:nucleoside 2-deoxyribosyltransferase
VNSIYLIGSLRNPSIPELGEALRNLGYEVFDDWHAAGPTADDEWQRYEKARGHSYPNALRGWAAKHVFEFDKKHLDRCDAAVLVMPAGKSGHLELGYMAGKGKRTFVMFEQEPERWDVMYQFAEEVFFGRLDFLEFMNVETACVR